MNSDGNFHKLIELMRKLRAPGGCPWDREQTHSSILPQLIEETYELVEAINSNRLDELKDELADLLLHVLFHAEMAAEEKQFDINDVVKHLHDKLVRRHPHIFDKTQKPANSADEVKKIWAEAKRQEGKKSLLGGVPKAMPAMQRAWRLNEKASSVGFDWQKTQEVFDKISEERQELEEAIVKKDSAAILEEYGDMLFAMINLSRFLKVDPEKALHTTNDKFVRRFDFMEKQAEQLKKPLTEMDINELESLYQESRKHHT